MQVELDRLHSRSRTEVLVIDKGRAGTLLSSIWLGQSSCQGGEPKFELLVPGYSRKLLHHGGGDREVFRRQVGELAAPIRGIRRLRLAPRTRQLPGHKPGGVGDHSVDRMYSDRRPHSGPLEHAQQGFDATEDTR